MTDHYDVLVVGGGAAGLSAGIALARSRRSVLVVDAGEPRNAAAEGVHNYLGREGVAPRELYAAGAATLEAYAGEVRVARALSASRLDDDFGVLLDDGSTVTGRRLVVTSGGVDELPEIDGLRERWGRDVLHCPYCHGWEVRGRSIGVVAGGPMSVHQALMFRQLSEQVVVLAHGASLDDAGLAQLGAAGIEVAPGRVASLVVEDDRLTGVRLAEGGTRSLDAVVVASRVDARSPLLSSLGVAFEENPMGEVVTADPMGQTSVPGVYVAGNVTDPGAQVMAAAAAGTRVGAVVNFDLISTDLEARMSA